MVKNKFATRALNAKDEPILVTMELHLHSMDVTIKSFGIGTTSEAEIDHLINKWMSGDEVNFPEGMIEEKRAFTDESLLPDTIKVDGKSGAIRQLQNEWSYLLLNTKLFEQFNTELDMIKQKAGEIKGYSHELFDQSKAFWEKILEYKKEREISQEKLNFFKEEINTVFDHLKFLKESMLKEKDELSEKIKEEFDEKLAQIDSKLEEGGVHFKNLMDELKDMQSKLRSEDVKRDIKNILFDNIQSTFERIKVKRDNVLGGANNSRISGLQTVLDRIQKTLDLDKKDLDFNLKKLNVVNNKLELQLREAKIKVLKDRISSKEEKVADINKTLQKLTKKSTTAKETIIEEASEIIENIKQEGEDILSSIGEKLQDLKEQFNEKMAETEDPKPEEREKVTDEKPTES
jgi:chromosome segregation ATPase